MNEIQESSDRPPLSRLSHESSNGKYPDPGDEDIFLKMAKAEMQTKRVPPQRLASYTNSLGRLNINFNGPPSPSLRYAGMESEQSPEPQRKPLVAEVEFSHELSPLVRRAVKLETDHTDDLVSMSRQIPERTVKLHDAEEEILHRTESVPYNESSYRARKQEAIQSTCFKEGLNRSPLSRANLRRANLSNSQVRSPTYQGVQEDAISTISAAPSAMWSELDELKDRIKRLELSGNSPTGSVASSYSKISKPVTGRQVPASRQGFPLPSTQRLLQSSIERLYSQDIAATLLQPLEAAAMDAIYLAQQPEDLRTARRVANNLCRSLTEICLGLTEVMAPSTLRSTSYDHPERILLSRDTLINSGRNEESASSSRYASVEPSNGSSIVKLAQIPPAPLGDSYSRRRSLEQRGIPETGTRISDYSYLATRRRGNSSSYERSVSLHDEGYNQDQSYDVQRRSGVSPTLSHTRLRSTDQFHDFKDAPGAQSSETHRRLPRPKTLPNMSEIVSDDRLRRSLDRTSTFESKLRRNHGDPKGGRNRYDHSRDGSNPLLHVEDSPEEFYHNRHDMTRMP